VCVADRDRTQVGVWLSEAWQEYRPFTRSRIAVGSIKGNQAIHTHQNHLISGSSVETFLHESERLHAGRFRSPPPLLAAHLGAGTAAKRWSPANWTALVGWFLQDGWRVVVIGGLEDVDMSRVLEPHASLRDWTGRMTVPQTTAFLERADLFLGADSGPSHLAACAGTPSVVLFSGTNRPGQWRPWSRRSLILQHDVTCRPCHHKTCPLVGHPCMAGLDPERVYRVARRWWARLHQAEWPHVPI
jgi:ADP-heptose:LPS heptosyltransferase